MSALSNATPCSSERPLRMIGVGIRTLSNPARKESRVYATTHVQVFDKGTPGCLRFPSGNYFI